LQKLFLIGTRGVVGQPSTKPQGFLRNPKPCIRAHRLQDLQGTPDGIQRAPKLDQEAVSGGLYDRSVMLANAGLDEVSLGGLEEP